ncbi:hypothetical protein TNCV_439761 [Trichonephila clavipes]|nr:hypothetical protein TNCV_439761 [Trichonephila clavipes]
MEERTYCNDYRHQAVNRLLCGYEPHIQGIPATINFCAFLSWIAPETFDSTRIPLLFHPRTRYKPRKREPSSVRERTRDGLKTSLSADPKKLLPHKQNLDSII